MNIKIRKGDTVEVVTGKREDKGQRGEVIKVILAQGAVIVQSINMRKKHQRQVQQAQGRNMRPGIIEYEAPLPISNVMLVCPKCNKATRVSVQRDAEGNAQRFCKKCGALLD